MTLEEMGQYIDEVKRLRKSNYLSFLGGEPLLHPDLEGALYYAIRQGFNVGIYTNGILLDEDMLSRFALIGVKYIMVNNPNREYFCKMFREASAAPALGFSFIVRTGDNMEEQALFFKDNIDVVKYINFSFLMSPYAETVVEERLRKAFGFEWGSYLGTKYDPKKPGKLLAVHNGKDWLDGKAIGDIARAYREEHGKYHYMGEGYRREWQSVVISFNPRMYDMKMNHCHPCTDSVLYKGNFVPMCTLEWEVERQARIEKVRNGLKTSV